VSFLNETDPRIGLIDLSYMETTSCKVNFQKIKSWIDFLVVTVSCGFGCTSDSVFGVLSRQIVAV